jgi:hypothetical protein
MTYKADKPSPSAPARDIDPTKRQPTFHTQSHTNSRLAAVTQGTGKPGRAGLDVSHARGPRRKFPIAGRSEGLHARVVLLVPKLEVRKTRAWNTARTREAHTRPRQRSLPTQCPHAARQSTETHISLAIVTFDPMMANHGNEVSPCDAQKSEEGWGGSIPKTAPGRAGREKWSIAARASVPVPRWILKLFEPANFFEA